MPTEWLEALPKIIAILEKAGMLGLMVIAVGVEAWVIVKYRRDLIATYHERDLCRLVRERYRAALTAAGIKVDIADIVEEMKKERNE